ncbi:MAG: tRNA 2-thiouridine(34) synthase MnmA [Deltaproteobacteria bacterium]|nr:MAG: tRNA 2-thiouridine(34) synthase MnmA [Deltaproteobacteria bacterium]
MKPTVAVAISGGVDSLTAAWLLKEQGYPVIGVHFITGYEAGPHAGQGIGQESGSPDSRVDAARRMLRPVADRLRISIEILDGAECFQAEVVDYFVNAYRTGQTPSPCLVCNPALKFGELFRFSRKLGARQLATGHYARVERETDGRVHLYRGLDPAKDQSYFLARLSRKQLGRSLFPLGEMTKSDVVALARKNNLFPVTEGESQDICFIDNGGYGKFLAGQAGFTPRPGPIVNMDGDVIGQHRGLHLFTIGQRRGINCPAPSPYYVIRLDTDENCLVVGPRKALFSSGCRVSEINWIGPPPASSIPVSVKIRYRHPAVPATIVPTANDAAVVCFGQPQEAVTPGQGAVFYRGDEVLGGGWIIGEETGNPT